MIKHKKFETEVTCPNCGCTFLSDNGETYCSSCRQLPQSSLMTQEEKDYIHQDIRTTDLAVRLDQQEKKIDALEAAIKTLEHMLEKKADPKTYSKKCIECDRVFVANHPAVKKCDDCK